MSVKMSICYENKEDLHFDQDYFLKKHIPLVQASFEPHGLKKVEVSFPLENTKQPPRYRAITELYFEDAETVGTCIRAAGREVTQDVRNYTNSQPTSYISTLHQPG